MNIRIKFNDGHEEKWDATGYGGEPEVPYTFEFDSGVGDNRVRHNIPLFAIQHIEFEEGEWR